MSEPDEVRVFVGDSEGPDEYVGFFEDTGETGDLYVSDRRRNAIVEHLQVYRSKTPANISEDNVCVVWSADGTKCGVLIHGYMKAIIDVARRKTVRAAAHEVAISDNEWLSGFERHLQR